MMVLPTLLVIVMRFPATGCSSCSQLSSFMYASTCFWMKRINIWCRVNKRNERSGHHISTAARRESPAQCALQKIPCNAKLWYWTRVIIQWNSSHRNNLRIFLKTCIVKARNRSVVACYGRGHPSLPWILTHRTHRWNWWPIPWTRPKPTDTK